MGYPNSWMVYSGMSHLEMDDDWGYPHFRKPPYIGYNYDMSWCWNALPNRSRRRLRDVATPGRRFGMDRRRGGSKRRPRGKMREIFRNTQKNGGGASGTRRLGNQRWVDILWCFLFFVLFGYKWNQSQTNVTFFVGYQRLILKMYQYRICWHLGS